MKWVNQVSKEGYGEVQETLTSQDFAVAGLSRQLNGQTIPSERPGHVMREQWHPIGVVGLFLLSTFQWLFGLGTPALA
jgi:aldehyde dehydrogenase (NAD+)